KLVELVSFYNGQECRYLAERNKAKEELDLAKGTLRSLQLEHANYKEKFKLQEGMMLENGQLRIDNDKLKEDKKALDEDLKRSKE
ncbi:hypothetical protein A2U01_0086527, partial [Trifolium medium]|nr:hypothetical protein [Trifolium medium]